jgi:hypothetical protein
MNKYVKIGLYVVFVIILIFFTYIKIWEISQPKQYIENVKIQIVEPYNYKNDLHLSMRGYRIYVEGVTEPIDFPLKNWDSTVQLGDTVELVIKHSFRYFGFKNEFDGVSINDYK